MTLPDRYLLLGAAFVYGVPLVLLLLGGALAGWAFGSDFAAAAGAMAGLAAAFPLAPGLRRRLEQATLRRLAVRSALLPQ